MRCRHALGDGGGIDTEKTQKSRQGSLGKSKSSSPDGNVIICLSNHLGRLGQGQDSTRGNLNNLLDNDVARHLIAGGVVAAQDLFGGVKAVLGKEIEDINNVEE